MYTTIEHTIERRRRGDALVHPITQDEIVTHVIRIDGLTDNLSDEFHHELSKVVVDEANRQDGAVTDKFSLDNFEFKPPWWVELTNRATEAAKQVIKSK